MNTRTELTASGNSHDASVLLYDGLCGFCDGTVQFILAHDRKRTLRFATLQGEFARALLERHPELRGVDSLMLVQPATTMSPEVVLTRSAGAVAVGRYLGGVWALGGGVFWLVPRPIRDFAYDAFARVRYRVFGRRNACRLPSAGERARFLD